jgi:hypothetical protein
MPLRVRERTFESRHAEFVLLRDVDAGFECKGPIVVVLNSAEDGIGDRA